MDVLLFGWTEIGLVSVRLPFSLRKEKLLTLTTTPATRSTICMMNLVRMILISHIIMVNKQAAHTIPHIPFLQKKQVLH